MLKRKGGTNVEFDFPCTEPVVRNRRERFYRSLTEKSNGNAAPLQRWRRNILVRNLGETRFLQQRRIVAPIWSWCCNGLVKQWTCQDSRKRTYAKQLRIWETGIPGVDKIQIYWIKKLTALHSHLAKLLINFRKTLRTPRMAHSRHHVFATQRRRQLFGEELQPITCCQYVQLITAAIADKMYRHLERTICSSWTERMS